MEETAWPLLLPVPARRPLDTVDNAGGELRRGGIVKISAVDGTAALAIAAEAAPHSLPLLSRFATRPVAVALTGQRAAILGLAHDGNPAVLVTAAGPLTVEQIAALADPLASGSIGCGLTVSSAPQTSPALGAVTLAKLAGLLPAAVLVATAAAHEDLRQVDVNDILAYGNLSARSLSPLAAASAQLTDAGQCRIVPFGSAGRGPQHLALVIGEPGRAGPVLTRLHSECLTGDLLGSLRCDCGDQLRGAIAEIGRAGGGVLLYLAQEGRGIGLVNKLRAYDLQDAGFDTVDANRQLGFGDDERIYLSAAEMLHCLGFVQIRLLTNNPAKVDSLVRHGIVVTERVPHVFPSNDHNEFYLRTKAKRSGHLF